MNESMEALKKQNEDLATQLTAAKGLNGWREEEHEQRRARDQEHMERLAREMECTERRERIRREKQPVGLDHVSSARGSHHTTVQN